MRGLPLHRIFGLLASPFALTHFHIGVTPKAGAAEFQTQTPATMMAPGFET